MIYAENKVSDVKIAYIGGGSHGWAWTFMTDLAMESSLSGTVRLYDIDEVAAKNNQRIANRLFEREDVSGDWSFTTVCSLEEALIGADFVLISILPGTFEEMQSDVHFPERYGIYQSVGDTSGPGGLLRALRTIPMFVEIANAIKEYASNAWVINYTNPMTLCVKTLYHIFPEIKAFGCCHEVFGTQKILRNICELTTGLKGIDRNEIMVNVLGINHFTWFDQASYQGIDLFPIYKKFIEENFTEGYHDPDRNWANGTFNCAHRVKFDLFQKFGLIAAAGDRHLAEFLPGDWYLKNPETVKSWKFALTTVEQRKVTQKERNDRAVRLISGEDNIELKPTGEEGIMLMKALCGLGRVVSNVNIPNTNGQIPNLPKTAVVETNAVFERNSIKPVVAGRLPDGVCNLILPHVEGHELILQAALTCDFELALKALVADPLVEGKLSESDAREMLTEMIKNTIKYLPEGFQKYC